MSCDLVLFFDYPNAHQSDSDRRRRDREVGGGLAAARRRRWPAGQGGAIWHRFTLPLAPKEPRPVMCRAWLAAAREPPRRPAPGRAGRTGRGSGAAASVPVQVTVSHAGDGKPCMER